MAEIKNIQEAFDVFETISSRYYWKQMYYLEDDGTVYSRVTGKYRTISDAIEEFCCTIEEVFE